MDGKNGTTQVLVNLNKTSNHSVERLAKDQINLSASIKFRQMKKRYFKRETRSMGVDSSYYLG